MELKTFPRVVVFDLDSTIWIGDIEYVTQGPPYTFDKHACLRDRFNNELPLFEDVLSIMNWLAFSRTLDLSSASDRAKLMATVPDQKLLEQISLRYGSAMKKGFKDDLSPASTAATIAPSATPMCLAEVKYLQIAFASRPVQTTWSPKALKVLPVSHGKTNFWDLALIAEIYPGDKSKHLTRIAKAAECSLSELILYDNEKRNTDSANQIGALGWLVYNGLTWKKFLEGLFAYQCRQM